MHTATTERRYFPCEVVHQVATRWNAMDRGQRSMLAEQIGYANARFGKRGITIACMNWDDLVPSAQRNLLRHIAGEEAAVTLGNLAP